MRLCVTILSDIQCNINCLLYCIVLNFRVDASLPTVNYALEKGAKSVVLMSHLGRPGGKKQDIFSLKPVADYLSKKLAK